MKISKTLLLSLVFILVIPVAACAENPYSADEQQMLDLINAERAKEGVGPLSFNPTLNDIASSHSQEMIEKDYFSHNSYDGSQFWQRLNDGGYSSRYCAENIAMTIPADVERAHNMLMNSPGHRANIMNPNYNEIGIGIWIGEYEYNGRTYTNAAMYTQNFGWTSQPVTEPEPEPEPAPQPEPEPSPEPEPAPQPKQGPDPLGIIKFSPASDPSIYEGERLTFSVSFSNACDVTWYANGNRVKASYDTTSSSLSVRTSSEGTHTIRMLAEDEDDTITKEWTLTVQEQESFDPMTYDTDSDGRIDKSEYYDAYRDYRAKKITRDELITVRDLYRSSWS